MVEWLVRSARDPKVDFFHNLTQVPKRVPASNVPKKVICDRLSSCPGGGIMHHLFRKLRLDEPYGSVELTFSFSLNELGMAVEVLTILVYILASNSSVCSQRSMKGYLH